MDKLFNPQVPLLSVLSAGFEVEQIESVRSHCRQLSRGDMNVFRQRGNAHLVTSSSPSTASVADVTVSRVACRSSVRSLSSAIGRKPSRQSLALSRLLRHAALTEHFGTPIADCEHLFPRDVIAQVALLFLTACAPDSDRARVPGTRARGPSEQARDDGDFADGVHGAFPAFEQALVTLHSRLGRFEKEREGGKSAAVDAAEVGEGESERIDLEMDTGDESLEREKVML